MRRWPKKKGLHAIRKLCMDVGGAINISRSGAPPVFWALTHNSEYACAVVRMLTSEFGADLDVLSDSMVPLLHTILQVEKYDPTEVFRVALSLGANPDCVDGEQRPLDALCTNIEQSYWLYRARQRPKMTRQEVVLRREMGIDRTIGLDFSVVGQFAASSLIIEALKTFRLLSKKPMVLIFAGPSGHGKTELAASFGQSIVKDPAHFLFFSCDKQGGPRDVFGAPAPYVGHEKGSALNNFMCENKDQDVCVVLDEFDRMETQTLQGFHHVFDKGEGIDVRAREGRTVSCRKAIFILTTNLADPDILSMTQSMFGGIDNLRVETDEQVNRIHREIGKAIHSRVQQHYGNAGPALMGRVSDIIPFLPFNPLERAVASDRILRKLAHELALPCGEEKTLVKDEMGGFVVRFHPRLCLKLAALYSVDQGYRSLENALDKVRSAEFD